MLTTESGGLSHQTKNLNVCSEATFLGSFAPQTIFIGYSSFAFAAQGQRDLVKIKLFYANSPPSARNRNREIRFEGLKDTNN
jgi:hypothetical protein